MRNHWPVKNRFRAATQWNEENFLIIPQTRRAKYVSDGNDFFHSVDNSPHLLVYMYIDL